MSIWASSTNWPALSMIERLTLTSSPLITLLSGSRSAGSNIEIREYPLLSKEPVSLLEP